LYFFLSLLLFSCNARDTEIQTSVELVRNNNVAALFVKDSLPPPVLKPPPVSCGGDIIFTNPERQPYFSGCENMENKDRQRKCSTEKVVAFIYNQLEYPKEARDKGIEGTAIIRFTIKKDGSLSFDEDLKKVILRDPGGGCGEEALSVLKKMPKWNPAMMDGKPVSMQFTMPVKFKLKDHKLEKAPPTPSSSDDKVFKIVESMPRFPGCEDFEDKDQRKKCSDGKIVSFIMKNIKYPSLAKEKGIEGTIVIRFIIEKDGSISFDEDLGKVILRDPGGGLGEEGLRVIKLMPKWIPGRQDGKPVRVEFTMPIKICLAR
jgi:TonB family protein